MVEGVTTRLMAVRATTCCGVEMATMSFPVNRVTLAQPPQETIISMAKQAMTGSPGS